MATLPTDASLTGATTTNAQQKANFSALRTFLSDLFGTDSGDKAAARAALAVLGSAGGTMTGALNEAAGANIASASTINLTTATGNLVEVTGTTAITAITLAAGAERTVRFTGILTLTNGASLTLPGAANITTAAGDIAIFRGFAAGIVRCVSYTKVSGAAVVGGVTFASQAEGQAGTDTTKAMNAAVVGASTLGVLHTMQNMTASRVANGTVYNNGTGRPIWIHASGNLANGSAHLILTIGSLTIKGANTQAIAGEMSGISGMIPAGANYSIAPVAGSLSNLIWTELR